MSCTTNSISRANYEAIFGAALARYTEQTGKDLLRDQLATEIQQCLTPTDVLAVLLRQAQAFQEFRNDSSSLTKCLSAITRGLYAVATSPALSAGVSLAFPPAQPIFAGIGILLAAASDVDASYDNLVDLFGCVEHFLKRLGTYAEIPLAPAMTEILVKIMVELLSVFALATQQIKEGRFRKYAKKLLGENDIAAVLRRLDRLTDEEARMTVAQTLEVVYGLINNMTVVMEDGNASTEGIRQALVTIQQTANEMARMNREQLQQDFRRWLSPPDPSTNHNIARKAHHDGTATWFTESNAFKQWKSTGSLLWVHGLPGSGKSVLCSTIVQHAQCMRATGLATVAYFYADFRDPAKQDIRGILSSLIIQLCTQADHFCEILSSLYSTHDRGFQQPDDDALAQCLKDMLIDTKQAPVYLVIDALDECPNSHGLPSPRAQALKVLKELIDLKLPHLHFCVTSRPEVDIRMVLEPLEPHSVSLHDEDGQNEDIRQYIKSVVLSDATMREWPNVEKKLVIDTLAKKCGGMFRWAYCQLETLRRCPLQKISRALHDLPKNLDETYERTLQCIDEEKWEYTCRIFQFLTVSPRSPRVEELAELFAITVDAKTTGILKFNAGWRYSSPEEAVLGACSSLIAVVDVYGDRVVQFAHFSVREFLVSDRLQRSQRLSQFYVVPRLAHTFLAKACLTILLQLNSRIHKNSIGKMFPLATYAAQHWVDHAQHGDVSSLIECGMELLFDGDKPYFAPWIWVYDVDNPSGPHMDRTNPGKPEATPLYYAALCGFLDMVERLIDTHPCDVNTRASDGGTPLHAALRKGHSDVALFLLGKKADAKAQNNQKETPLHLASRQGDINVMQTLMNYGADPNAKNGNNETPLSLASSNGMLKAAGLLINHGAGADNQGPQGRTPLHVASENGHHGIVRLLVNKGAAINALDRNDRTPLHLAADKGRLVVARALLDQGADVDAWDAPSHWTPLHLASSGGQVDMVRLLLNNKADVNAQDEGGWTALHLAAYNGHEQVGKILLKHGADRYRENYEHKAPFQLALEGHHSEMAKLLSDQTGEGTRGWKN